MRISFGKTIGGVRFSTGNLLGSSRRGRSTQRNTASADKKSFIKKISSESNKLSNDFLILNNIDPKYAMKNNLDLADMFNTMGMNSEFDEYQKSLELIQKNINKLNYGSNLTLKMKDKLIDLVFKLQDLVDSSGPGLNQLSIDISSKHRKTHRVSFAIIFLMISVFMTISHIYYDSPNEARDLLNLMLSSSAISLILYSPVYIYLKAVALFEYKKESIKHMKNIFNF